MPFYDQQLFINIKKHFFQSQILYDLKLKLNRKVGKYLTLYKC